MYSGRTFFLFLVAVAIVAGSGRALGWHSGVAIGACLAVAAGAACWWFADRFVLDLYDARPAPYAELPSLYRTLQRLSIRAAIPMPRLYVVPEGAPNAFATGRNPDHAAVAVTEGLTRLLNESEIEAVLAFEVARIAGGDTLGTSVAAAAAGAIGGLAWLNRLLARLVRLRARSLAADRRGAALTENPLALASALEKMDAYSRRIGFYNGSRETGFLFIQNPFPNECRTHPRTRDRVAQLWKLARNLRTAA